MSWQFDLVSGILAQAAPAAGEAAAAPEGKAVVEGPLAAFLNMLPFIAIPALFYFLLMRPQSQEQKKKDELLNSLKKDDRVVTIGGIIGTVANVSANGKEVILKMEDNAKIRILRSAIQAKLTTDDSETEAPAKSG